ncbi:Rho GTPase activation protein [Tricharina praecox]|uniref:Rho GTPase activation protein n=1 Tax=Tricharina praecox TaxID=43433 RepID=UPI0022201ACE|nr:Rho GTPase activation protein [Tricharina praecox]KAI5857775.1 Rho GTPase activation protein [Tricharina praecox]
MTKKDQQASSLKSKSSSNSAGGLGGGISAGIRAVNDSITAPLSKSVSPKNKAKKKKLVGSLKGNDDDDDFPFFLPPSSSMLQQRANPPNHSHPPTSPKMTDPVKLMAQRSVGPSLTVSVSPKEPARSAPSSRTPSASPPTLNLQTPVSAQLRRREISPSSPATDVASHHSLRPGGPRRSSSQDGNFFSKVKKGKEHVQAGGLMAASFLDKVSHVAWDKLKSPRLNHPRHGGGRSSSPQHGRGDRYDQYRDTSLDVEVFGMDLREAVVKTRIVRERKMEGDATFWIPAIAYRCLQYLNVYGPHEVGIYRIPGSTAVVDELRAEFKIKHDVDLFENPPDDLHTVSSLLKGWFRSLPDAILPIDVQKRIYEKCKDQTESLKPPQAFVDELSNLPPYNYYLLNHLFSHLSTVCMESDVNKMNLSNLGMVFCSTLRIDRFCFNWLVNNWADCWAGCLTEETEYQRSMPLRFPSNSSSSHQQHSAQTPSHQQHPSQTSSHQQQPRTPPYQQPQQIPAYQQPPQTTSHEQSPMLKLDDPRMPEALPKRIVRKMPGPQF